MHFASATAQRAALQARKVSARELLDAAIARIEAHDGQLNAVVVRDFERARAAATEADRRLARGESGALLGVPLTVKECFNVAGLPTTWGIPGTQAIPVHNDAVAVARLRAAGAVILGKTNVATQLADWQTSNPVYGTTNNPWDVGRTPGGSSGGAAAAVAAGFVALEMGSDLNGSLRIPAHCCGVFAHRPSYGLVPTRGFAPPGVPVLSVGTDVEFAVIGPMARCAADLALMLDVLAGPDDDTATAYGLQLPPARHSRLQDYRVLVLDEHPLLPTGGQVRTALNDFSDRLARAGCRIARASPLLPDLTTIATTFGQLLMSFFGADMPLPAYEALQAQVARMKAGAGDLPPSEMSSLVLSHRDWIAADRARTTIAHQWRQLFRDWDVVLCPVLPVPAIAHDHAPMDSRTLVIDGRGIPYPAQAMWSSVAAVGGLPATAMPIGMAGTLPVGVQIIGPHLEDRSTLRFAELAEREWGGFVPPPGW